MRPLRDHRAFFLPWRLGVKVVASCVEVAVAKLAAAALIALFVTAVPAQAFAAVRLVKVQYDSPGSDTGSNSSLNAEFDILLAPSLELSGRWSLDRG